MDPLFDRVAKRAVSGPPLCSHPRQDWYCRIHIVDDDNVRFPGIQSVEPSHILGQCPLPRDRHCQEQRIEPCIVEAFANVASGRQYEALFPLSCSALQWWCNRQTQYVAKDHGDWETYQLR